MSSVLGQYQPNNILGQLPPRDILGGRPSFASMYPGVGMDTVPLRSMTPEMREWIARQATPALAPSQMVQGMVGGASDLATQANQAMPWGGNDPSAIGIDTQAGTIDPSVMVPFATNVAGMVEAGNIAFAPAVKNGVGMGIKAYHGSPHDFDRPTMDFAKDRYLGRAIYLAPDPDDAAGYGRFLHQFDVDVENPAVIETSNLNYQISDDYAKQLRDAGHDAIVLRIIDRDLDTGEIVARYDKEIAIWDENKLKKLNMLDLESEGVQNTLDEWHGDWRKGQK